MVLVAVGQLCVSYCSNTCLGRPWQGHPAKETISPELTLTCHQITLPLFVLTSDAIDTCPHSHALMVLMIITLTLKFLFKTLLPSILKFVVMKTSK